MRLTHHVHGTYDFSCDADGGFRGPPLPSMKIRYAAKTDVGMKRTHNEDYYTFVKDENLFIVADGMGGHASGEVASKLAADTLVEFYHRTADEDVTWPYKMDRQLSYIENRLVCGIKLANWRVYEAATKDPRFKGMGTTIVSCLSVIGSQAPSNSASFRSFRCSTKRSWLSVITFVAPQAIRAL